ncbi:MAG TPA: aminodeoxychorismate/anthranilate synthase component II [Thermoanaerobaculia bacterium]|nr:aminodeoxychorismate/anthranilate synthase component II [Thermoanaerobaculia bacterium]
MILVIDNYDSFTWNLVQQIERLSGESVEVVRNDDEERARLLAKNAGAIVISPGPGRPEKAGCIVELIRCLDDTPLLGVCLGHQAIGMAFGATIVRAPLPVHGKRSAIRHQRGGIFETAESPLEVARYHSLVIDRHSLPGDLRVDAETDDGLIMAVSHRRRPIFGVQFHPESYGTRGGDAIIEAFLRHIRREADVLDGHSSARRAS